MTKVYEGFGVSPMQAPVEWLYKFKELSLIDKNDPILTTPTQPFDFLSPPFEPIDFAQRMVKFMYDKNGIGLAANQIGIPYSIFAMRGSPENLVCFNPKIVWYSDAIVELEEGCLSYPGLILKIKRPQHIRVRFNTPNGEVMTQKYTGMTSRIFQHEYEHLQGKKFTENISKLKLNIALRKLKKKV
jgi:peptide deformylase